MVAILGLTLFSIFKDIGDRTKCVIIMFASITKLESLWAHWRTRIEIRVTLGKYNHSLKRTFFVYQVESSVIYAKII